MPAKEKRGRADDDNAQARGQRGLRTQKALFAWRTQAKTEEEEKNLVFLQKLAWIQQRETAGNLGLFQGYTIKEVSEVRSLEIYFNEVKDDRKSSGSNGRVNGQGELWKDNREE